MKKKNYLLEKIVEILGKEKRGKVLDLGCGDGDYSKRIKALGFEVIAADLDEQRFKYKNEIEFRKCNITEKLPFPDNFFDYILLLEVIEHLRAPFYTIKEISRILKMNGILFLSTPNILNIGSRLRFLFEGAFDFFREPILDYAKTNKYNLQNLHIVVWRYHELEYLLFENNLHVKNIYTDLLKPQLKISSLFFLPLMKFQCSLKERRASKKGGVDYRRIDNILFSKELLYGRHLIIKARKYEKQDSFS